MLKSSTVEASSNHKKERVDTNKIEEESMGMAEYMAIGIFSCLALGFILSAIVVIYQVSKHRKRTNNEIVKGIKAAELAEAERLQKKEDEALARAIQEEEEKDSDSEDESELGDKVPLPPKLVVGRLPNEE